MNLNNDSFLCLDIGTYGVRGFAHCIKNGNIVKSAMHFVRSTNTITALNGVIDELEQQLNTRFNSAFITGNFGPAYFDHIIPKPLTWTSEHKITELDLREQIHKIKLPDNFYAMHIIPMFYSGARINNIKKTPIGHVDTELKSIFGVIAYREDKTRYISDIMRRSHIKAAGFFDSTFVQNAIYRKPNEKVLFIDLGNEFTTVSIWGDRGPLFFNKEKNAQQNITIAIADELKLNKNDTDTLKITVATAIPNEMDRFTPVDSSEHFSKFSRADINDIFVPKIKELILDIYEQTKSAIEKHQPTKIIISGGGSVVENINSLIENIFNLPVDNQSESASINALSEYIWKSRLPERNSYIQSRIKLEKKLEKITKLFHRKKTNKKPKFIPILPSTLCFDMDDYSTYTMFASGGISMIHVDIMDGFYVEKIAGGINELANIRTNTNAHLHVHLMTESPSIWARDAINAGADTVIISTNTSGVRDAINVIKSAGKRCGIAINPETPINIIVPVLKNIDEVMVMGVNPGAAGQTFNENVLQKIKTLNYTRKKHGLKYLISVDGGINPETAKLCWDAGADLLVSGSYLAHAHDFPLAVQSLLKR